MKHNACVQVLIRVLGLSCFEVPPSIPFERTRSLYIIFIKKDIMGYPYHFVDLSDEQSARRRHLLDSYGQFAQLSILLVPLIYYLILGLRLIASRVWRHQRYEPVKQHASPTISKFVQNRVDVGGSRWARIQWALGEEVSDGWGTRQEWLIAGLWAVWLGVLATRDTGDGKLISFHPIIPPRRFARV